jgi:zinc protease
MDPAWHAFTPLVRQNGPCRSERVFDAAIATGQQSCSAQQNWPRPAAVKTQVIFAMDGASAQGEYLGAYDIVADWRYLTTLIQQTDAVTAEQVRDVARKYLTADNRTIGWFTPTRVTKEKPAPLTKRGPIRRKPGAGSGLPGRVAQTNRLFAVASLAPRAERLVLPNGMVLLLQENHANPTVTLRGAVDAGAIFDPRKKPGLANLVAAMLGRGTATRPKPNFREELDTLGAELTFGTAMGGMFFDGKCLSPDLPKLLELAQDALCRPVFELGEFARVRKEQLSALEEVDNVPLELAMGELRNALYPSSHAERHYVGGTEQSLRAVTRGDVLKFYREHYRPDSTLLAAMFSPRLCHGYPAADTRVATVEPSEPVCDIFVWAAMSLLSRCAAARSAPFAATGPSPAAARC